MQPCQAPATARPAATANLSKTRDTQLPALTGAEALKPEIPPEFEVEFELGDEAESIMAAILATLGKE
jgi:hypothetical protein